MAVMTGLSFVYVVLPLAMAVYLLCPAFWRPAALLGFSLLYYLAVHPLFLLYMIGAVALDWVALRIMERFDDSPLVRGLCLAFSVFKNLGCILLFQGILTGWRAGPETLIGLYVVTLSAMGCVLEAYRRQIPNAGSPVHFALYCFYFPRLAAGPMTSYRAFAPQLELPGTRFADIAGGLGLFIGGAVKFRVLGVALLLLYTDLQRLPPSDDSVLGRWVMVFALGLSVYFRFSGCADMARGISRMMGFSLPENFRHPFEAGSITDFLGRFNASLTQYVTRALGWRFEGETGALRGMTGLMVTGLAAGLWFGLSVGRLAWGIYLGLFLLMERYLYPGFVKGAPKAVGILYTLAVVFLGFALFDARSLGQAGQQITRMFGFGSLSPWSEQLGYLLSSNRLLLAAGVLLATSGASRLFALLQARSLLGYRVAKALTGLLCLGLLTIFSI